MLGRIAVDQPGTRRHDPDAEPIRDVKYRMKNQRGERKLR
jgi:hypothetical protein